MHIDHSLLVTHPGIEEHVCLFACLCVCMRSREHISETTLQQIFCACCMWPWVGSSLTAL